MKFQHTVNWCGNTTVNWSCWETMPKCIVVHHRTRRAFSENSTVGMTLHVANWWSVNRSTARNEAMSSWLQLRKITRQEMYFSARSRNHRCRGRAISITYSECVSAALVIQHAQRCAVLFCDLWHVRLYCFLNLWRLTTYI